MIFLNSLAFENMEYVQGKTLPGLGNEAATLQGPDVGGPEA